MKIKGYKKKGFHKNVKGCLYKQEHSYPKFVIVYKDGTKSFFNWINEVEIINGTKEDIPFIKDFYFGF